ncbi:MAG: glycosyltransferase family 2 protein [Candidatus Doudnabacteria bacterium]
MKVSLINVVYNSKKYIKPVFDAIFLQTERDLEVFAVICANDDGSKEYIVQNYPQVKILDPGKNLGFSAANNLAIRESTGEFVQLVNPDLILEPHYIEDLLGVFADPKVAAATGKLLRYDFRNNQKTKIIDSTGIVMSASGRARDRGQNQVDAGQFDDQTEVFGVSGAGPMFRRTALEKVKYRQEYFDEDFFMYWEDVDMSWRLRNLNYVIKYVPAAVAYHGRTAGQAEGGYWHFWKFVRHHKKLSPMILKLNYKNHILMYIKNAKSVWNPFFIGREIVMFGYVLIFETGTLKVLPELLRQFPKILRKRKSSGALR